MIEIDWIRSCIRNNIYYFSRHGDEERQNDNLTVSEIEEAIQSGIVIESYDDTGRGESCLVAGFTVDGKPVHIVLGKRGEAAVIVTAYIPSPPKFKNVYERG